MLSEYNELLSSGDNTGDAKHFFSLAKELLANGNLRMAATAYDFLD